MKNTLDKAYQARLNKILNEPFRYCGDITSYNEMIKKGMFVSKDITIQRHSSKKRNGYYKEFVKPRKNYNLFSLDGTFISVEKIIFDYLDLPINKR